MSLIARGVGVLGCRGVRGLRPGWRGFAMGDLRFLFACEVRG